MTQLDPATVRACIEALPEPPDGMDLDVLDYYGLACTALEALLPDPAEELVREWNETGAFAKHMVEDHAVRNFARWLTQNYTLEKK